MPVLMHTAALYCITVGDADTAPALVTAVVPGVTALMVRSPAPVLRIVTAVPLAIPGTAASVGMLTVLVLALVVIIRVWY